MQSAGGPMTIAIECADPPSDADRDAIFKSLVAYNEARVPSNYAPFAIRLRNTATGEVVGGLWAQIYYDWLFVELLFVPEEERGKGVGSKLICEVEARAGEKGCVGVWLDTFTFQAPDFYLKLGYEIFGVLDDYPKGAKRFFLRKLLPRPSVD
jgi:GNAT superfamily N-acetyltransferase